MHKKTFTFLFLLVLPVFLFAQVANDECVNAIRISNVGNFCSEIGEFSNLGATQSPEEDPRCFPPEEHFDVWFVFTAEGTDVSISIKGNEIVNSGGTIRTPQFGLYEGSCGDLTEVKCTSPLGVATTAQSFTSDLVIGREYFIRVSAAVQRQGTFQLCINNFNAIPDLSSDCSSGLVLCDKSAFTIPSVTTAGDDSNEIEGIECGPGDPVREAQSTWFKWICEDPGTLEFNLTPIDSDDDLDFILYELPDGLDDCGNKEPLRIMLSGRNTGDPAGLTWAPCIGETGLRTGEDDERENCGCETGDNNYVRPIDMVAGRAYALVVLNFTESGFGFTLEFSGTGTFRGPAVDFTTNLLDLGQTTACVGQEIVITDASSFEGGLTDWAWNFGPNASLPDANTQGPHTVSFNRPGIQQVLLSVTSVDGCIVSDVVEVEVVCCETQFSVSADITNATCPTTADGSIDLNASSDFGITEIEWDIGAQTEDISNLLRGSYEVQITDAATCTLTRSFEVSADSVQVIADITMPTCNEGMDGAINLQTSGGVGPYQISWAGFPNETSPTLSNLMVGDYTVTVADVNDCATEQTIEVRELELTLAPELSTVSPPTCNEFDDGFIEVAIGNGLGPYEYDWDGNGNFDDAESLVDLIAGSYQVQVRDVNRCIGSFDFQIEDPAPVDVAFDIDPVSCFGELDATVTAVGIGGTAPFTYSWNTGSAGPILRNVGAGNYRLSVLDANGCPLDSLLVLDQPDSIFFNNIQVDDVLCFGESTGRISILGGGGTPPYDFKISNTGFVPDNVFLNLPVGNYKVNLRDAEGCSVTSSVVITEPPLLTVDAGRDRIVDLGDQTVLEAIPSEEPVTYLWTPGEDLTCVDCPDPLLLPLNSTTYEVAVTNSNGCIARDLVSVTVAKSRRIYTPTAFSPNNDGTNDFFTLYPDKSATRIISLKVFDRWGELLFEAQDIPGGEEALGWDGSFKGEPMNGGVYIFMAEVEYLDGEITTEYGDVLLVR